MNSNLINTVWELLKTTGKPEILWVVLPLAITTLLMVIYFQRYKDERPGWNDYFANSLILIFVSMALFRAIYELDILGLGNYLEYGWKTLAVLLLLIFGTLIVKLNFGHFFPERLSRIISSPLTTNTIAFIVILYVHTGLENSWTLFLSLLLILLGLLIVFNLIKWPIRKMFEYSEKIKKKEKIENIQQEKFEISELDKAIKYKKKKLNKQKIKDLDKQKKEALRLKKEIKK
ncbi:hypothetical protein CMI45_01560 [Candidatus Pacearchaeota archaeon]|nr:hypothetical protein [Candidatus Pacearchaeota archaeon]|tara:strand:- start:5306 stop:6001 length:696 start_codon:yes stop_codon:yes gene_type:complete